MTPRYPFTVVITSVKSGVAAVAGTQDEFGRFTEGGTGAQSSTAVVYSGPCDLDDVGKTTLRSEQGAPVMASDATLILPKFAPIDDINERDTAVITYENGITKDMEIMQVRRVDHTVFGKFLQ